MSKMVLYALCVPLAVVGLAVGLWGGSFLGYWVSWCVGWVAYTLGLI